MARLFWMAVGAGAGMWAARKVKDKAQKYTPEGVADNVTGLGDAIRYFADEVRAGMAEREAELYRAIGADVTAAAAPPVLPGSREYRALPPARSPYGGRDPYGREIHEPYVIDAYELEQYDRQGRHDGSEQDDRLERADRRTPDAPGIPARRSPRGRAARADRDDRTERRGKRDRHDNQQGFRLGIPGAAPAPELHDRRDGGDRYDRKDRR
ncbi:DUF6167 family protein [Yinghuangia soli]|uniref:DUF6167 family protein n=1 Tax=Yinghuangia soli TaxID=2908204 RepID=A0AA41Q161_9ACTN|nr:DUF6167 family protein [Yinghuangia soli]MCF2529055.1 DUF6167 family protein [Yinghuangia soli]